MEASTDLDIALLDEGFVVQLLSDKEITGAYLQFKATADALASESYFDVNLAENRAAGKATANKRSVRRDTKTSKSEFSWLDVDFGTEIKEGELCYLVCVYDAEGNISKPQEICVTVAGWAANSDLIGEWHYSKSETYYPSGSVESLAVGEETCNTYTFTCENTNSFEYAECSIYDYETFDFRADATYTHTYKRTSSRLDVEESEENCVATYEDNGLQFEIKGKWTFDSERREIILVEYEQYFAYPNVTHEQVYPSGQGLVYPFGPATVSSTDFKIGTGNEKLGEDLNGDGNVNNDDAGWFKIFKKQ
ncbi:hypothetical protein ACU8V7_10505 [Zobellia nedashkovskayae]